MKSLILGVLLVLFANGVLADVKISILHTSDLHSHFTNRESPLGLGGFARLKTQIDQVRSLNENSLLLDSGDWSEGNIFFTLESGTATQRLLEAMNYDALVLGNHDWLVGPEELYRSLRDANSRIPILAANLDFSKLAPEIGLAEKLPPYVIKSIGGKRVGIFGLATFEFMYDKFLKPVKILNPVETSKRMVKHLRKNLKCDVVIALSHLGFTQDKLVGRFVKGIDLILGGHSHILLKRPYMAGKTPIVHPGSWGMYLGEYELTVYDKGGSQLTSHKIHQIDTSVTEDSTISYLVQGYTEQLDQQFGGAVFKDTILHSESHLSVHDKVVNDVLGNWTADALREVGNAEIGIESPRYSSRDIRPGGVTGADLFNLFPHVWNRSEKRAWNIVTFELPGFVIKFFVNTFARLGFGLKLSNMSVVFDTGKLLNVVRDIRVGGVPLEPLRYYKVAATEGILYALEVLKDAGLNLGMRNLQDTGKEAWREIGARIAARAPIVPENLTLETRLRHSGPDLHIFNEKVRMAQDDSGHFSLNFPLLNAGLKRATLKKLRVQIDMTPEDTLDEMWQDLELSALPASLEPGSETEVVATGQLQFSLRPRKVVIWAETVKGERQAHNNTSILYFHP